MESTKKVKIDHKNSFQVMIQSLFIHSERCIKMELIHSTQNFSQECLENLYNSKNIHIYDKF